MSPRPDARAGFLLTEALAALVVTIALLAIVLPFAGALLRHWRDGQASVLVVDGWTRAVARLTDDVAEAVPTRAADGATPFSLDPRRLVLVRPALGGGRQAPALEQVVYTVEAAKSGERLVRRATPFAGTEPPGDSSETTLLEGPYRFRFDAWAPNHVRSGVWQARADLPLRLDLAVTEASGRPLPFSPIALPLAARTAMGDVIPMLRLLDR